MSPEQEYLKAKLARESNASIVNAKSVAVLFGIIFVAWAAFGPKGESSTTTQPAAQTAPTAQTATPTKKIVAPPAAGEHMTVEYFEYVRQEAQFECEDALKKSATYDLRVAGNTFFGIRPLLRPTRINKYQLESGHVTFWGDDIEVQTEFGRWIPANYGCEWNPANKQVVSVWITPGQLPQSFGRD